MFFKLKREEIVNIDVLTTKGADRVCLIRAVEKTFQQASIIVLRQSFLDGYILKEAFDTADKAALTIDIRLPEDRTNDVKLNFGSIEFMPKYSKPIKLQQKKWMI